MARYLSRSKAFPKAKAVIAIYRQPFWSATCFVEVVPRAEVEAVVACLAAIACRLLVLHSHIPCLPFPLGLLSARIVSRWLGLSRHDSSLILRARPWRYLQYPERATLEERSIAVHHSGWRVAAPTYGAEHNASVGRDASI